MINSHHREYKHRGLALPILVGVLLSLFALPMRAQDFSWHVHAEIDANYVWRGKYSGGLSFQTNAEVRYRGFYLNTWWNVGATDWNFSAKDASGKMITALNPEVDMTIGYQYKGLELIFMHMYYFDKYADGTPSRYFDFRNHAPGGGGITSEWRVAYTISETIPLRIMWCTRTFGRDGYMEDGVLKRAFSSYLELKYTQPLPYDVALTGVIGLTPWKSLYTQYQKNFAVINLQVSASKSWQVSERCTMGIAGLLAFNPSSMQPLWNISTSVTWH